jgi:hypothetical protein
MTKSPYYPIQAIVANLISTKSYYIPRFRFYPLFCEKGDNLTNLFNTGSEFVRKQN